MFLKISQNSQGNNCARVWHRCFPVNFAKSLRIPFLQNTSGRLLLTGARRSILQSVNYQLIVLVLLTLQQLSRSSSLEVLLGKGVLKICSKFTGEHSCRSAISINLQSNFIEITLQHECFPVNLMHIFKTAFLQNTSVRLLLAVATSISLLNCVNYHS